MTARSSKEVGLFLWTLYLQGFVEPIKYSSLPISSPSQNRKKLGTVCKLSIWSSIRSECVRNNCIKPLQDLSTLDKTHYTKRTSKHSSATALSVSRIKYKVYLAIPNLVQYRWHKGGELMVSQTYKYQNVSLSPKSIPQNSIIDHLSPLSPTCFASLSLRTLHPLQPLPNLRPKMLSFRQHFLNRRILDIARVQRHRIPPPIRWFRIRQL